jgi:hypothetical protein
VALLAYEEAVRLFRMALQALREPPDEERRCQVLLLLADAQSRSGDGPASRQTFLEAAGIATRLDLPELLARAAFAYAGRISWARAGIDRQVIPLLRQALEALGAEDSVLRVLLLSRLAGALRDQPVVAPRAALGREAVAMARLTANPRRSSTRCWASLRAVVYRVAPADPRLLRAVVRRIDLLDPVGGSIAPGSSSPAGGRVRPGWRRTGCRPAGSGRRRWPPAPQAR